MRTKEYSNEVYSRFYNGGVLWFFERTDTNEFPTLSLEISSSHKPPKEDYWSKPIGIFNLHKAYLTKQDAEMELMPFREGGCRCCGNGSIEIPVKITEHEFVKEGNNGKY